MFEFGTEEWQCCGTSEKARWRWWRRYTSRDGIVPLWLRVLSEGLGNNNNFALSTHLIVIHPLALTVPLEIRLFSSCSFNPRFGHFPLTTLRALATTILRLGMLHKERGIIHTIYSARIGVIIRKFDTCHYYTSWPICFPWQRSLPSHKLASLARSSKNWIGRCNGRQVLSWMSKCQKGVEWWRYRSLYRFSFGPLNLYSSS